MNCVRCLYVIVYLTVCIPRHVSSQRPVQVLQSRPIENNGGIAPNIQKVPVLNKYPSNLQVPNQSPSDILHQQPPNLQYPVPNQHPINVQHILVPNQHPASLQSVPNQYPINIQNVPNQYPINIQSVQNQYPANVQNVPNQYLANIQQVQQQQPQQQQLPHQRLVKKIQNGSGILGSLLQMPQKVLGGIMTPKIQKRQAEISSYRWNYVSEAVNVAENKLFDSNSNSYGYTEDRHYYVVVIDAILRLSSEVYWQTQQNYEAQNEIYRKIYEETARNIVIDSMVSDSENKNSRMQYYFQNYIQLIKLLTDFKGNNPGMVSQYIINLKSQLSTISMLFLEISSKIDQVISQKVPLSYILENPDILQDITMAIVNLARNFNSFYVRNSYLNLSYEEHLIVQQLVKISTAIFKPQMVNAYNRMLSLVGNSKMVDHLYYHSLKHKNSEGYVTVNEPYNQNKYQASGTIIVYVLDKSKANQFDNIANSGNKQIINEKLLKQYLNNPNYKRVILIKDKTEANVITSPNKEWLDVLHGKQVLIDDVYSINCDVRPIDTTTQNYNDDIDIKICAHFKKSNLEDPVSITDIQPNRNCNLTWPYRNTPSGIINTESPKITFDDILMTEVPGPVIPSRTTSCKQIWVDGVITQSCGSQDSTTTSYWHREPLDDYTPTEYPWSIRWTSTDPRSKLPWTRKIIPTKSSCQPIWVDGGLSYEPCQPQERTTRSIWDKNSDDFITTDSPWPINWTQKSPWYKSSASRTISSCQPVWINGVISDQPCRSQDSTTQSYDFMTSTESTWSLPWAQIDPKTESPWNKKQTYQFWTDSKSVDMDPILPSSWPNREITARPITNDWRINWTQKSPWYKSSASKTISSCQPIWINGVISDQPCRSQDSTTQSYDFMTSTESTWSLPWAQIDPKTESPWNKKQTYQFWTDSKSVDMDPILPSSWPNREITARPITNDWRIKWSDITQSTNYDWIYSNPTTESNWDKKSEDISTTQEPWSIQWISQDPARDIRWRYSNPTSQLNTDSNSMEVITSTQLPWPTWKYISRIPNYPRPIEWTSTDRTGETRWKVPSLPLLSMGRVNTESPKINWYTNDPTINTDWSIKWRDINPTTEVYWDRNINFSPTKSPFSINIYDDPSWQIEPNNTQSWNNFKWDIRGQSKPTWDVNWWSADPVTSTPTSIKYYPWKIKWTDPKLSTRAPQPWSMKWNDYEPIFKATLPPPQPIKWISYRPITESNFPTAKTLKWDDYDPTWQQNYDPTTWNYDRIDVEPTQSPIATEWEYVTSNKWIYQNPTTESWQPKWSYQETTTPWQINWSTRRPPLSSWSINWDDYDVRTESSRRDIYPTTKYYWDRKVDTKLPWDIFWTQDLPKQTSPQPINWKTNGLGNIMWIGEINGIPNDFDQSSDSINDIIKLNCYNYNDYISPINEKHNFNSNRKEAAAYILIYKERIYFILRNRNDNQYPNINTDGCHIKDITCDVEIPPCIKLNKLYLKNVTIESNTANYFGPLIKEINANALFGGNGCTREPDYSDWVEQDLKPILENNNNVKQILYPNSASIKPVIGWKYVPNVIDEHPFALRNCYSSNCLKNFMYCANGTCFWNSIKCYRGNCDYGVVRCVGAKCYKSNKQCNVSDCLKHFNKYVGSCLTDESSIEDETMIPYSRRTRSVNNKHCVGQFCFEKNSKKPYIFHRK